MPEQCVNKQVFPTLKPLKIDSRYQQCANFSLFFLFLFSVFLFWHSKSHSIMHSRHTYSLILTLFCIHWYIYTHTIFLSKSRYLPGLSVVYTKKNKSYCSLALINWKWKKKIAVPLTQSVLDARLILNK